MRKYIKQLMIVGFALAAIAGSGIGHTASLTCGISDTTQVNTLKTIQINQPAGCVVEPLLSRSDNALVYVNDTEPDNLGEANLKNLKFDTSTGRMVATIQTAERIPRNINEFPEVGGKGVRAPYGGVHVLALFQTPQLGTTQVMGQTVSGGTTTFGPYNASDNYHFFFYYGITISSAATPTCGWGIYDQFGQLFTVFAQSSVDTGLNWTCSNNGAGTITFNFPYTLNWRLQPENLGRTLQMVKSGQNITNIKAFSWMDHEVGGPPPVGLIVGATHYTDVIPKTGYDFGAWVGDPNSGGVPGHTCSRYPIVGTVPNPLSTGGRCYVDLQSSGVGLGMRPTSFDVEA